MTDLSAERFGRLTDWLANRPWWQLAVLAAVIATVVNFAIFAIAAGPAGLDVESLGPIPIWLLLIATYTVVPAAVATRLAARLARRPGAWRRFVGIAVAVLLLSFLAPPLLLDTTVAITLMLDLMHVVAAAMIVAVLGPRLRLR